MFFKSKDLMTVGNLLCGIVSVLISMEGMASTDRESALAYIFWAGFFIIIAFLFDAFDGVVARLLKSQNKFGAEFDNVADLISYSVAPGFLIYLVYTKYTSIFPESHILNNLAAGALAACPPLFGAIRFARFNVKRLDCPGFWIGFPRPGSALLILSLTNSHFFITYRWVQYLGIFIVLVMAILNLSLIPYIAHHGRKFSWYLMLVLPMVAFTVFVAFVGGIVFKIFPKRVIFDLIFCWLFCYAFLAWLDIPAAKREEVKAFITEWRKDFDK